MCQLPRVPGPSPEPIRFAEETSLWLRPFRPLLEEGKPLGNVLFLVLHAQGRGYAFGALTRTDKERLIFWPAIPRGVTTVSENGTKGVMDHLTLELVSGKTHVTTSVRGHHPGGRRPERFEEAGLGFWFVLAVEWRDLQDQDDWLERRIATPASDEARRKAELEDALGRIRLLRIESPSPPQEQTYVLTAFYLADDTDRQVLFTPGMLPPLPGGSDQEDVWNRARLTRFGVGDSKLVIVTACPPGALEGGPVFGLPRTQSSH